MLIGQTTCAINNFLPDTKLGADLVTWAGQSWIWISALSRFWTPTLLPFVEASTKADYFARVSVGQYHQNHQQHIYYIPSTNKILTSRVHALLSFLREVIVLKLTMITHAPKSVKFEEYIFLFCQQKKLQSAINLFLHLAYRSSCCKGCGGSLLELNQPLLQSLGLRSWACKQASLVQGRHNKMLQRKLKKFPAKGVL